MLPLAVYTTSWSERESYCQISRHNNHHSNLMDSREKLPALLHTNLSSQNSNHILFLKCLPDFENQVYE